MVNDGPPLTQAARATRRNNSPAAERDLPLTLPARLAVPAAPGVGARTTESAAHFVDFQPVAFGAEVSENQGRAW